MRHIHWCVVACACALVVPPVVRGEQADLDKDGQVHGTDLAILLGSWGACAGCPQDFDQSGLVDAADLAFLLAKWGIVSDIDADSDNNDVLERSSAEDSIEESAPGKFIGLNDDDDDQNQQADLDDSPPPGGDDDLVDMVLQTSSSTPANWRLVYPTGIKVYDGDNQEIPTNQVFAAPPGPNPKAVKVEGVQNSSSQGDFTIRFEYDCDGDGVFNTIQDTKDRLVVTVISVDLTVDSNNDSEDLPRVPQRDDAEDDIEDHTDKPGVILGINNDDDDSDGIPDYADGHDFDGQGPDTWSWSHAPRGQHQYF